MPLTNQPSHSGKHSPQARKMPIPKNPKENLEDKNDGKVKEELSLGGSLPGSYPEPAPGVTGKKATGRSRIFLALIPEDGPWKRLVRIREPKNPSESNRWTHPEDLHMTLLFGGEQPQSRLPAWKEAVELAAETLGPSAASHFERTGRIAWDPKRKLLALEFPSESPFWKETDRVGRMLSERLLDQTLFRPVWPHLTLARHAPLERESVLAIGTIAHSILDEAPIRWTRVRLLESTIGNPGQGPRYRILFERPMTR